MKKIRMATLSSLVMMAVVLCANAEDLSFCDSVPMQVNPWTYNFTFPKFDSSMGALKSVEIRAVYNLTQSYRIENVGESNATVSSSLQSVLQIETPDAKTLMANTSLGLSRELAPFDGTSDYSGLSGIDLNLSSSSGTVVWDDLPISDFIAKSSGEGVVLLLSSKDFNSFHLSGDLDSKIRTMAESNVCLSYDYEPVSS